MLYEVITAIETAGGTVRAVRTDRARYPAAVKIPRAELVSLLERAGLESYNFV